MIRHFFKYKWYIAIILVLIIAEPSLNSVLNFWLQRLFNTAQPGTEKIVILRLLTVGFLLWISKRLISFIAGVIKTGFICNAKKDVKHDIFISLFHLDTSNISEFASSGEYISVFTNDITILETRFYNQIVSLISGLFSVIILGSSFLALNIKLALAITAFGIVSMFVPFVFSKNLNERNLVYSQKISQFTQKLKEYMVAYPTIKNYSIEQKICEKFDYFNKDVEESKFEADYALNLANSIGQLLSWFMQFIGVGLGLILVIKGEILVGTVIAAQSFASDLAAPLQEIIFNINSIRSVKEIVKKIKQLSGNSYETGQNNNSNNQERETVIQEKCDITFQDFSLQMADKQIIDHFSFVFETGKKYLVVGLNGSGKSTLFKALKKWYLVDKKTIFINETDISQLKSQDISSAVSYLNENVSLFSGSIKDNISLFRECNTDLFSQAINDAQIHLDLNREIIDEGRNVSSGEQRRIEIARSLLQSVRVLIFDEVVSTLDTETAYEIEKMALDFKDKTVIFISHNFSGKLIREYDEILVMENGTLCAHGNYDELMQSCEYFRKICLIKFGINK